jgi:murein L,D-transpeptidase YcbB/YkuD
MERWRWMPRELNPRHIRVNIARFELEAVANGKTQLRMPIVVGLRYRETPQFTAPMTEIVFNPTWHVPHKIALHEKAPLIRKDPSYLQRNNYVLYNVSGGDLEQIDPEEINWSAVSQGNFPYRLHQLPGSKNALGKMRFTIVNPFDIYLHSTPQQSLFEKPSRAYSHGCIRVKDYIALAEFAFSNSQKWNQKAITTLLENSATRHIPLPQPLPVHIYYFTVGFNEKLEPYFMNDVYGQDAQIWQALAKRRQQRLLIAKASPVEG